MLKKGVVPSIFPMASKPDVEADDLVFQRTSKPNDEGDPDDPLAISPKVEEVPKKEQPEDGDNENMFDNVVDMELEAGNVEGVKQEQPSIEQKSCPIKFKVEDHDIRETEVDKYLNIKNIKGNSEAKKVKENSPCKQFKDDIVREIRLLVDTKLVSEEKVTLIGNLTRMEHCKDCSTTKMTDPVGTRDQLLPLETSHKSSFDVLFESGLKFP